MIRNVKKIIFLLIAIVLYCIHTIDQSPKSFKYQAVTRDASGEVIANQVIGLQISILQGNAIRTSFYLIYVNS